MSWTKYAALFFKYHWITLCTNTVNNMTQITELNWNWMESLHSHVLVAILALNNTFLHFILKVSFDEFNHSCLIRSFINKQNKSIGLKSRTSGSHAQTTCWDRFTTASGINFQSFSKKIVVLSLSSKFGSWNKPGVHFIKVKRHFWHFKCHFLAIKKLLFSHLKRHFLAFKTPILSV